MKVGVAVVVAASHGELEMVVAVVDDHVYCYDDYWEMSSVVQPACADVLQHDSEKHLE